MTRGVPGKELVFDRIVFFFSFSLFLPRSRGSICQTVYHQARENARTRQILRPVCTLFDLFDSVKKKVALSINANFVEFHNLRLDHADAISFRVFSFLFASEEPQATERIDEFLSRKSFHGHTSSEDLNVLIF